jgi:hypothetical protein
MFRGTLRERVDQNVMITPGCWPWTGRVDSHGYGKMGFGGLIHKAHRAAYIAYVGEIPETADGVRTCVLHRCDNPRCVNPMHLFLGTQADNMRDKMLKGRSIGAHAGEANHGAKLNVARVRQIRDEPEKAAEWASIFGVSKRAVLGVIKNETWVNA